MKGSRTIVSETVWKNTGAYRLLVGKPERKRPRGRPRHRWEGKAGMDLKEILGRSWTTLIWLMIGTI